MNRLAGKKIGREDWRFPTRDVIIVIPRRGDTETHGKIVAPAPHRSSPAINRVSHSRHRRTPPLHPRREGNEEFSCGLLTRSSLGYILQPLRPSTVQISAVCAGKVSRKSQPRMGRGRFRFRILYLFEWTLPLVGKSRDWGWGEEYKNARWKIPVLQMSQGWDEVSRILNEARSNFRILSWETNYRYE